VHGLNRKCSVYISGVCKFGERCRKSHNVFDEQPKELLEKYGVRFDGKGDSVSRYVKVIF